jgi:hypothetical protein
MRRFALTLAVVAALSVAGVGRAHADSAGWHSEQPVAAGIDVPVPFGEVGDIECWQANRCVLIAAGLGGGTVENGMPAGIYAYDGTGWHLYSTVCGGHRGKIAWAGPDDFWTISDQRIGELSSQEAAAYWRRSLCHFENGEVVASYAEPLEADGSYPQLNAAACEGPSDCWFGGERLEGAPNVGAFHLHWDGSALTAVPSLSAPDLGVEDPGRAVFGLTFHQGRLYESVSVREGDEPVGETEPSFLHRIEPGAANPFEPLFTPDLNAGGVPAQLEGFRFAADGPELWALSGSTGSTPVTMLKLAGESFARVPLTGDVFQAGYRVNGFAAEPGSGSAWASFMSGSTNATGRGPARLVRIHGDGSVDGEVVLPDPEEALNPKGNAGPIACPAAGQCWMASSRGWLFHLGGPPAEGPDLDPAMHQLITFRPCDDACRTSTEVGVPVDDSGAEPEASLFADVPPYEPPPTRRPKSHPLYTHLRQKVIDETVLQLTFVLHARAHVRLIARERKKVVAKTARLTLGTGKHRIRLALDPKHWPTHLSFQVHRVKKQAS